MKPTQATRYAKQERQLTKTRKYLTEKRPSQIPARLMGLATPSLKQLARPTVADRADIA